MYVITDLKEDTIINVKCKVGMYLHCFLMFQIVLTTYLAGSRHLHFREMRLLRKVSDDLTFIVSISYYAVIRANSTILCIHQLIYY